MLFNCEGVTVKSIHLVVGAQHRCANYDYGLRNLRNEKNLLVLFEQRGQAHIKTTCTKVIERKRRSEFARASGYVQCDCLYWAGDSWARTALSVFCSHKSQWVGTYPLDRALQDTIGSRKRTSVGHHEITCFLPLFGSRTAVTFVIAVGDKSHRSTDYAD